MNTPNERIEVLGTHFNVNAYSDDAASTVSLLEGKVKVSLPDATAEILHPGQQSIAKDNTLAVRDVDVSESVAWKNGEFMFNKGNLDGVMRKLARWYDIEIEVAPELANIQIWGSLSRYDNFAEVLRLIKMTDDEVILRPLHLSYTVSKTTIVVKREEAASARQPQAQPSGARYRQQRTVSGLVSDEGGNRLPGVSVRVKGNTSATLTNDDGRYTIAATEGDILVFSSVGFVQQEVSVGVFRVLDITLQAAEEDLDEVVVTALGIKRDEKSLGYAVQRVQGSTVQTAKEANFVSSLTGKIAGLNIQNPPGMYEDPRISLRGESSILVVIGSTSIPAHDIFFYMEKL